jgi:hypothetical protein
MFRSLRNILYFFKRIREIKNQGDKIYYRCLKCNSEIIGYKWYGKLHLVCKCGHSANVYTGWNLHFKREKEIPGKNIVNNSEKKISQKDHRLENFNNYLNLDLDFLYHLISPQRDIKNQITLKQCKTFFNDNDYRIGYENILKFLQKFCGLESTPIRLIWEQIYHQTKLIPAKDNLHIIGTTYILPFHSIIYYSVYLNPKFISNIKLLITTIAHELSHIYVSHNRIRFKSSDTARGEMEINEQMTDLLAITLGMGDLMCDDSKKVESFNTAYLTNDMICQAFNLWQSKYLNK